MGVERDVVTGELTHVYADAGRRTPAAVTRRDLDAARCATPGCTEDHGPLYLHGRCHPGAAVNAHYVNGELHVACAECDAPVVAIAVAP